MGPATFVVASELEWQALTSLHGFPYVITGVGIPAVYSAFLSKPVTGPLISVGIGGAYPGTGISIGDVVVVNSEVVGDLGMEQPELPSFVPLRDYPFGASHKVLHLFDPKLPGVASVPGCTVSSVTGTESTGTLRRDLYAVTIETMEGYAIADVAATFGVRCVQVRAVSNIASHRDMHPQNVRLALDSLCVFWEDKGQAILEMLNEQ